MQRIVIIGGPGGTGSSTIARGLAKKLNCKRIYGGNLMRYVGLRWFENDKVVPEISETEVLENIAVENKFLNDEKWTEFIKNPIIQTGIPDRIVDDLTMKLIENAFNKNENIVVEGKPLPFMKFPQKYTKYLKRVWVTASISKRIERYIDKQDIEDTNQSTQELAREFGQRYITRTLLDGMRFAKVYDIGYPVSDVLNHPYTKGLKIVFEGVEYTAQEVVGQIDIDPKELGIMLVDNTPDGEFNLRIEEVYKEISL